MITGSHNPKDHNGFKFVLNNMPFYGDDLIELSENSKNFLLRVQMEKELINVLRVII